jgi:hypothetical protein
MKTASQSFKYPIEVKDVPAFTIQITISARKEMLPFLRAAGFGEDELPNKIRALLEQARDACDGSVDGLIISNLEE